MTAALTIAAKAPLPGHAKTRLAAGIGEEGAIELYRAFLADLAARFPEAAWYVDPLDAWQRMYPRTRSIAQPSGSWTERQRWFFQTAAERGEERSVLTASDSPQLEQDVVSQAFAALDDHDVVLVPVTDGGYSLIGMHGWHDVLTGIAMSTDSVCGEIVRVAHRLGTRIAVLEPTYDVDEVGDLEQLRRETETRSDLAATRAALATLLERV